MFEGNDFDLFIELIETANQKSDGHLTIMKFTTNWWVAFETVDDRHDIPAMDVGQTFSEAARNALTSLRNRKSFIP
jgi:hypothetical protein